MHCVCYCVGWCIEVVLVLFLWELCFPPVFCLVSQPLGGVLEGKLRRRPRDVLGGIGAANRFSLLLVRKGFKKESQTKGGCLYTIVVRYRVIGTLCRRVNTIFDYMSVEFAVLCFYKGEGATMSRSPAS